MANPFTTCTLPPQELSYAVCTHLRDSCLFWWHVFYLFVPFWWGLPTFPSWLLHSHSTFSRDGSRRLLFPRVCDWRDCICFRQIVMLSFMLVKIINVGWYYYKKLIEHHLYTTGYEVALVYVTGSPRVRDTMVYVRNHTGMQHIIPIQNTTAPQPDF